MRQLFHPKAEDITVESVLHALSDPVRAQIYMDLAAAECAKNCTTFKNVNKASLPKSTLSQHFRVLREAGLIISERKGVELHNRTRCSELKERFGEMVYSILQAYAGQGKSGKKKSKR